MRYKNEALPLDTEQKTEPTSSQALPILYLICMKIPGPSYTQRSVDIHSRIWTHRSENDVSFPFVFQQSLPQHSIVLVLSPNS